MGKNASIRVQTERGNEEEVKDLAETSETLNWLSSIASTQTFQVTSAWKPTICCSHLCVHTRRKCFLFSYNNTMIQCLCVCNIPWLRWWPVITISYVQLHSASRRLRAKEREGESAQSAKLCKNSRTWQRQKMSGKKMQQKTAYAATLALVSSSVFFVVLFMLLYALPQHQQRIEYVYMKMKMTAKNAKCANGSDSNSGQIILHFGLMLVVVECPSIVHSRSGAVSRCIFLFFRISAANNKEPTHFSPQFVLVFLFVVVWPLLNRWNELLARIGEAERLTHTALIRPTTAAYTKMRWIANAYFYLSLRTRNRSHSFFFSSVVSFHFLFLALRWVFIFYYPDTFSVL